MAEKLTLERLEQLLEEQTPDQIRAQYGEELSAEGLRLLAVYASLDQDLVDLAGIDPAPVFRRRPRPLMRVMRWLPAAAIFLLALLIWQIVPEDETRRFMDQRSGDGIGATEAAKEHTPEMPAVPVATEEEADLSLADDVAGIDRDEADAAVEDPAPARPPEPMTAAPRPEPDAPARRARSREQEAAPLEKRETTPRPANAQSTSLDTELLELREASSPRQSLERSGAYDDRNQFQMDVGSLPPEGAFSRWQDLFRSWPADRAPLAPMFTPAAAIDWSVPHTGTGKPPLELEGAQSIEGREVRARFRARDGAATIVLRLRFRDDGLCSLVVPEPR